MCDTITKSMTELEIMEKESRFILPPFGGRWVVDNRNLGDPFATPWEVRRREENRNRIEQEKSKKTHAFDRGLKRR